jgi:hypothetical protein
MKEKLFSGGSWVLILLLVACSSKASPPTFEPFLPTETQKPITFTPTRTFTSTLSPTVTNTSTPIQPDLEIVNWAFVPPTFYFRKTYFVAIIRNNSDYGIIAPNGGVVTLECAEGEFSEIYLSEVPPLAPYGEAVFLQAASESLECSPIMKAKIKYEVNGMELTDKKHEVPNWKTEVMKDGWESPAYRLTNSFVTVENTSQYPCMVEEIITLAFDYSDKIIGIGTSELSDEGESVPIPPQEKMGFYIFIDTGVYNHAIKLKAYPIARGNSFCIDPDESVDNTQEKRAEFPDWFHTRLEVAQSGGWGNSESGYSDRWYLAFTVKNSNSEAWVQGFYWHADVYDENGRLIDYLYGHSSMAVPPLGTGAGFGRGHFYLTDINSWRKEYRINLFVYTYEPQTKSDIKIPLVENIDWAIKEETILVSFILYNPKSYTIVHMGGAIGLLFNQNQDIIGGGNEINSIYAGYPLNPGERRDLVIDMHSSENPARIEIYPRIML